ncbi:YggS family pyridoxal phosphate-dependent enzyme [Cohnella lubricantis]|uniref:YggS family pyridoxal phosphate-dependent enzyme n=1 Tax=Cohnella lubricantis TaxID=2163172 RepID=UPI001C8B0572|nr:YggS family pyridoxal phosphate-dependent enzyme [Cohnella lubricantis]MBP2116883.1 pyridoxal phosphate enzyme (YggS family) [Cohnella lubricantis]
MNAAVGLQDRMREVESRIGEACRRSGRAREDVNVVAVTKYVSAETAVLAVTQGIRHIGENRWPDSEEKWRQLQGQAVFHFIGSLQTRKVKDVVGRFDYIHSLDRLSLAEEIQKRAAALGIVVPCFVQVNVSGEASKHGMQPEELPGFAAALRPLDRIKPIGLMTMAPLESGPEETRPVFRGLRKLRDELNAREAFGEPITELSMGMSGDFEVAIEEGATWVRLGSVLVGRESAG